MAIVNRVVINDLKSVSGLCCVCLTKSKKMIFLDDAVEPEDKVLTVRGLLYKVTYMEIPADQRYPSYVCPMCMSMLKMVYQFKTQFENSQKLLCEYFGECLIESPNLTSLIEVIQDDIPEKATVELISKKGKYDLKDVFIIENKEQDKPNYSGFLRNLGKEVSASFSKERDTLSTQMHSTIEQNSVTIINLKTVSPCDLNLKSMDDIENDLNLKPKEHFDDDFRIIDNGQLSELPDTGDDMDESDKKINCNISRCSVCEKVFANKKYLKRHIERVHLHERQTFVCEVCGFFLKSRSSHYHHMLKHYGKRHQCSYCNKMYFNSSALQQHITAVHENARLHLCMICGKSFNYANALDYHMRIHTDERKYKCSYCNKTFRMQCGLNRHVRIHTGIRPYKCSFCEKAFRSKGELDCHEMIHTGYRPYHCKYCQKGFTKTYNLKMHLLGHKGRHVCEICERSFIEFDFLKIHMKSSHYLKEFSSDNEN